MGVIARASLVLAAVLVAAAAWFVFSSPISLADWLREPRASFIFTEGWNPHPVKLVRPRAAPLSAIAQLGKEIFYDPGLSSSGRLSCASCHDPRDAYAPMTTGPAVYGGPSLSRQGVRAVPSLMYLEREPNFSIGPDDAENENVNLAGLAAQSAHAARATKNAQNTIAAAANLVPQGGLFWDGRADTLQNQALIPLLSPFEMDGGDVAAVAAKLAKAPYAPRFARLFGSSVFNDPPMAVAEAMFTIARYEIEEPGFHPYSSKFDDWLEGKARMTRAEMGGYQAFNDPARGNCAACHLDQPGADGLPPLLTDHQFEALGVPRNHALATNRDPRYFDLGLCGPYRTDMNAETRYCGMFRTPTLRNTARRHAFFHNGVYRTLQQVLDFYDFRDTEPAKIYPRGPFDDLPAGDRANIDRTDPPFTGKPGDRPPMDAREEADIIAFLGTLTDGWAPP